MDWRPDQEQRAIDFIHDARLEDFPVAVIAQAKRCLLDLLASTCAGLEARSSGIARRFALSFGGSPECTLFGDGRRAPLPLAVYANATACEALDCDDGYNLIKGHPGAFLLSAILAFAEREEKSGHEILETLVVGYEVGIRAGLVVRAIYPTYHGSGSWGGLGTAAIAARWLKLTPAETGHALGAAEYHGTLAPIMRCVSLPGMVKDGVAWSAFAAASAALMTRDGFTSTPSLFGTPEADGLVGSIGREYMIERLYFKPYCTCRWAQPAVRAALAVVREHRIDPAAITSIRIETFAEACALSHKVPTTSEEAQYSVAYPVAAALLNGDVGPAQVLEQALGDPRAARLMECIRFAERPDFQVKFPRQRFAEVIVNGYSSGQVSAHGDPDDPLSDEELEDKFRRYSARVLTPEEAVRWIEAVRRLEESSPAQEWIARLGRPIGHR